MLAGTEPRRGGARRGEAGPEGAARPGTGRDDGLGQERLQQGGAEQDDARPEWTGRQPRRYGEGAGLDRTERGHTGLDGTDRTGQDRTGHGSRARVGAACDPTRFYSRKKQTAHCECFCPWRVEPLIICPSPLAVAAHPVSTESCEALGDSAATAKRNPFHIPLASFEINGRRGRRKQR